MSIGHKSSNTLAFRLMLYQRALHPELFDIQGRQMHRYGEYEAETWVCPAGHVVRFQTDGHCLAETVIADGDHLPEHGLVHAMPCLGEKDYELDPKGVIGYITTIQTEMLSDNLYAATYREMLDLAAEHGSQYYEWCDETGIDCLSLLDVQKFRSEFHMQSYHMVGAGGMVLRTQSIFEIS